MFTRHRVVDCWVQAGADNAAEAHKVQQWNAEGQTGRVDPHHSAHNHGSQIQHQQAGHDFDTGLPLLREIEFILERQTPGACHK